MILHDAKEKFGFKMANFCIMPTHFHLLIKPSKETNLSKIMQWIKTNSAKKWNFLHGSKNHLWGDRFFARPAIKEQEFDFFMEYIDNNPVNAGITFIPEEWKASGAFYRANNITGLVDLIESKNSTNPISQILAFVANLLPPNQLSRITKYVGAYADELEKLHKIVKEIPFLGETQKKEPAIYLHYFTRTADYFICEYDREDTMYGKVRNNLFPDEVQYQKLSLNNMKKNKFLELDFTWVADIQLQE